MADRVVLLLSAAPVPSPAILRIAYGTFAGLPAIALVLDRLVRARSAGAVRLPQRRPGHAITLGQELLVA